MNKLINTAFMKLGKRAESADRAKLVETFVDAEPLLTLLGTTDHQIMYGRRGAGKTHALLYLHETRLQNGDISTYLDMRTLGSTGGLFADTTVSVGERATRLLADTLAGIHESLFEYAIQTEALDLAALSPVLDDLAAGITEVAVVGTIEAERRGEITRQRERISKSDVGIDPTGAEIHIGYETKKASTEQHAHRTTESGVPRNRVHFGRVGQAFHQLARSLAPLKIWVMLDEWSSVPLDLQPYLADLIRRALLPHAGIIVKIAAIEQRSAFQIGGDQGDYIGLELGADISANLDLDDFMVFENDSNRATRFFRDLLYKHFRAVDGADFQGSPSSGDQLIQAAFTQRNAFEEYVRAAEGVPRDAINIVSTAAQKAFQEPISIPHVRAAARTWYQRDKEAAVAANGNARSLLHWIIDDVIGKRRARAFLLKGDIRHALVDSLFDARVLHLLKRNIAAHDQPGVRYDVYKLDFGCYVDLIGTTKAPSGLLVADDGSFIDVPPDDYRAIRRAILDIDLFESSRPRLMDDVPYRVPQSRS